MDKMEKLYTPEEIAKMYNKSYYQVIYALMTGRLKGHKIGWAWVVNDSDLPKKWPEREKKMKKMEGGGI